jgi:hypothetical protein
VKYTHALARANLHSISGLSFTWTTDHLHPHTHALARTHTSESALGFWLVVSDTSSYIDHTDNHLHPHMDVHTPALWLAFQVHYSPIGCNDCSVIRAQWAAMEKLLAENKTRTIGVSNFCRPCLECLSSATVQPAVNQFEYVIAPSCDPNANATSDRPNAPSFSLSMHY